MVDHVCTEDLNLSFFCKSLYFLVIGLVLETRPVTKDVFLFASCALLGGVVKVNIAV
jgi:hypothetical protein